MPTHTMQPPEWIDAAPIQASSSIEIAAPPSAAWERIADHATWPEWFTALDSVEVVGSGSGVGGGRRVTAKKATLEEEFTAWDENEHFAFAITSSKIPILESLAESVRVEPTDSGCRVTYRQGLQAKRGFGKALELAWKQAATDLTIALANLKSVVEASASDDTH